MLDFTSALYLGIRHGSASLDPWRSLTTGVPAALRPPRGEAEHAAAFAALVGCERGLLAPSTLHLAWDLFGQLARTPAHVLVDASAYPIARWGVERAVSRGARCERFRHLDADDLAERMHGAARFGRQPVIVTDGICPRCGGVAPLARYLALARTHGGFVVLDDTQALGILGARPDAEAPFGHGGGGTPRWCGARGPELLVIASLAKAFGAPVALLAGSAPQMHAFEATSETRVHCSAPSAAALAAAAHALAVNAAVGDRLRARLAARVRRLRRRLDDAGGLAASSHLFPVQSIAGGACTRRLHARLRNRGVHAVLHRAHDDAGAQVSVLVTARHTSSEIDRAAAVVADVLRADPSPVRS